MELKISTMGIFGLFWILCLLLNASAVMYHGEGGFDGGSSVRSSSHTRRLETEIHAYNAQADDDQCEEPPPPKHGRLECRITDDKYVCTATCYKGYNFPDTSKRTTIRCSRRTGKWLPFNTFEDCIEGNYECQDPSGPYKGHLYCKITYDKHACTATCLPGYIFPDGSDSFYTECSTETGEWLPTDTIENCVKGPKQCEMPIAPENGAVGCSIIEDKYLCTGACMNGYTFPDGSNIVEMECLRETGEWLPYETLGECTKVQSEGCKMPKNPVNGYHSCSMSNGHWICEGTCNPGYEFSDGTDQVSLFCNDRDGQWSPRESFGDCYGIESGSLWTVFSLFSALL